MNKDEFIDYLKDEIRILRDERNPTRPVSAPEDFDAPPIERKKRNWAQLQAEIEKAERERFPNAQEIYWSNYIREAEKKILKNQERKDASKISETVSADAGSSTRESEGIGSEQGSSEGVPS